MKAATSPPRLNLVIPDLVRRRQVGYNRKMKSAGDSRPHGNKKPEEAKFRILAFKAPPPLIARLDAWQAAREIDRSAAIRQLIEAGLNATEKPPHQ